LVYWKNIKTLCSRGVPEEIRDLSLTYTSTDIKTLEVLFNKYPNQIACVISEPEKTYKLSDDYLQDLASLCQKNSALLILDEMVTGFKTDFPGSLTKYGVEPDMATWGKGIAKGFSFCALTGKKSVMEIGGIKRRGDEKVFLMSTTHGGETHSIAAGLATIDVFEKENVVEHNHRIGSLLIEKTKTIIQQKNLGKYIETIDCPWMPTFVFKNRDSQVSSGYRTLAMQEMIKNGILFQGIFVPCFSHNENDVDFFLQAWGNTLEIYEKALESGWENFLEGPPTQAVFKKYV